MSALADEGTQQMARKIIYDRDSTPSRMRLNELMEEVDKLKADVDYWQTRCVKAETEQEKFKLRNEDTAPPSNERLEDTVVAFNHALTSSATIMSHQYTNVRELELDLTTQFKAHLKNDPLPIAEWMSTVFKRLEQGRLDFLDRADRLVIDSTDDETNEIVNKLDQAVHHGELTGMSVITTAFIDACIQLLNTPNLVADAILTICEAQMEPPLGWIEHLRALTDDYSLNDTAMVQKALVVASHYQARDGVTQEKWCRDFGEQFNTAKPSDLRRYVSIRNKVEKIRSKK